MDSAQKSCISVVILILPTLQKRKPWFVQGYVGNKRRQDSNPGAVDTEGHALGTLSSWEE